jgi:hypothetical protein
MTMLFAFGSQKETECMSPHQNWTSLSQTTTYLLK